MDNPLGSARTIRDALGEATHTLSKDGIDTPQLDAEVLLAFHLQTSRERLLANLDTLLQAGEVEGYRALVARRAGYEPVAYITGHKEFFGLDFLVTPAVLIPRPETEVLVDVALALARQYQILSIAEVGVGSGAVAVALATHLPDTRIYATDISQEALEVAAQNCLRQGVAERVLLLQGDLLQPLPQPVGLIVANLPYLTTKEIDNLSPDVANYEPREAIAGGSDGLDHLRRLLEQAPKYLEKPGGIVLEIGPGQASTLADLTRARFPGSKVALIKDHADLERVLLVLAAS
ncbi:MAG: peptide chain release factor N(5)-glutamine methyltransferase [Chloroflexi bacterium]|nr:peptide chain release factor N(5)-glutamine methyltransferase [Chloroflexota bacterium]